MGKTARAILLLSIVFLEACTTMTPCEQSMVKLEKGMSYFNQTNFKAAAEEFDKAVMLCDDNIPAHAMKAIFYAIFGEFEKALNYVDYTISISPDNYWGYTAKGAIYELMGNRLAAIEWQQKSCDMGNKDGCEAAIRLRNTTDEQLKAQVTNLDMLMKLKGLK
jgi:tetratricopeptide (TPR) repeat protein